MMQEHDTSPPSYLSESDLISLMDKSGIGTDATIHQHIKTIQDRKYAEKNEAGLFKPTLLGLGLVVGYSKIGISLHKPELRAKMEKDMNEIVNGTKTKKDVIDFTLREMQEVYHVVWQKFQIITNTVKDTVINLPQTQGSNVTCFKCGNSGHFANRCTENSRVAEAQVVENANSAIKCFKCLKTGHYANNCKEEKAKKTCENCGISSRHPKNSECVTKRKKK